MTIAQKRKFRSTSRYLSQIHSAGDRAGIRAEMRRLLSQSGEPKPNRLTALTNRRRAVLSEVIFAMENKHEPRRGDRSDDPRVAAMRDVRNRVYDDLGWNESAHSPSERRAGSRS